MQRPLCLAPIVALLVFLVFAIGAYGQEDPSSVVQRFQDARNRGDVDATMALVATDVSYVSGLACPPERPCIGTDAVRRDVQLFISDGAYSSDIGNSDVSGTIVQVQLGTESSVQSSVGVERTLSDVTAEVRDGQISSWQSVSDVTDPQTAWWLDHQPDR